MAKMNVEYDTVDKTCSISIDGKPLSNVQSAVVYCGYDTNKDGTPRFCMEVATYERDQDNDMGQMQRITAAVKQPETPTLQKAIAEYVFPSA